MTTPTNHEERIRKLEKIVQGLMEQVYPLKTLNAEKAEYVCARCSGIIYKDKEHKCYEKAEKYLDDAPGNWGSGSVKAEKCPSCGGTLHKQVFDKIIHITCGMCPYEKTFGIKPSVSGDCEWREDSDGNYETSCNDMFVLTEGTPEANHMKYCPMCGKTIKTIRFEE